MQVLDGVKAGEEVVASALFLIDSESKLREATAKMLEGMKADRPSDGKDDMEMQGMSTDDSRMESSTSEAMDMGGLTLDGVKKP